MKVGYIRVSTKDQNTARQEVLMKELGIEKVFIEKVSGKATITERQQLEALMSFVREGDTVIVESISRFGRNIKHFLELLDMLKAKNVEFVSVKVGLVRLLLSQNVKVVCIQNEENHAG